MIIVLFVLSLVLLPLVLRKGFFKLSETLILPKVKVSAISVIGAFVIYLGCLILVPQLILVFISPPIRFEHRAIAQLISMIVALVGLIRYSELQNKERRERIWGRTKSKLSLLKGFGLVLLCYPIVMTVVEFIHIALEYYGFPPQEDQVAISQLKNMIPLPWLFASYAVLVVTVVPVVEELLFRGFMQNFLLNIFGVRWGIIVTSLLFAAFHFSIGQGITNIELLVGLFLISYCIGVSYVKTNTLFVPIGMHSLFNGLSLILLLLSEAYK